MHRLCRLDSFEEGKAFECEVAPDPLLLSAEGVALLDRYAQGGRLSLILLQWQGRTRAYCNACPHRGTPLNLLPDRFFDVSGRYLQCTTHGALFRPEDGYCVVGPCVGCTLIPLPLLEEGDWLALNL